MDSSVFKHLIGSASCWVLQHSRPVINFTEDFDFMAMNEKFNKDEVWGHLGKNKAHWRDNHGELIEDESDYILEEDDEALKLVTKVVKVHFT